MTQLTERGELVIGSLMARGRHVIGALTETGRIVFPAVAPDEDVGGGYAVWRVLHTAGRSRLTMRVWDESTQRLAATGRATFGCRVRAKVRFIVGDELGLLGLDLDDEDGLIG